MLDKNGNPIYNMNGVPFWLMIFIEFNETKEHILEMINDSQNELFVSDATKRQKLTLNINNENSFDFDNYFFNYFSDKKQLSYDEKLKMWKNYYFVESYMSSEYVDGKLTWTGLNK